MIDLRQIEKYRENNRIEAKKALGGLPHSIWETYSAFANTLGGIILLGVEEYRDKTLHTVDLPDPEGLVAEFFRLLSDPRKASVNILTPRDVKITRVNGDRIIIINVPRADRTQKPVFVDGSIANTYRRNGEGDYRCTEEERGAMLRDAALKTQDMRVLEKTPMSVFNLSSVRGYRWQMRLSRPDHVWEKLKDEDFLLRLGAAGKGADGRTHPTAAGLLMFGKEKDIVREFPEYSLRYDSEIDDPLPLKDTVSYIHEEAGGNVFDFCFRAFGRLRGDVAALASGTDAAPVYKAVREALTNCLVNADYCGRGGVSVLRRENAMIMSNPGVFRIELNAAKSGGVSDPRNGTLLKMFNLIDMSERVGSGIPNIYRVWREHGWVDPVITQSERPDRTTIALSFKKRGARRSRAGENALLIAEKRKNAVAEYLTYKVSADLSELSKALKLSPSRTKPILQKLEDEGVLVFEGDGESRIYKLKS